MIWLGPFCPHCGGRRGVRCHRGSYYIYTILYSSPRYLTFSLNGYLKQSLSESTNSHNRILEVRVHVQGYLIHYCSSTIIIISPIIIGKVWKYYAWDISPMQWCFSFTWSTYTKHTHEAWSPVRDAHPSHSPPTRPPRSMVAGQRRSPLSLSLQDPHEAWSPVRDTHPSHSPPTRSARSMIAGQRRSPLSISVHKF